MALVVLAGLSASVGLNLGASELGLATGDDPSYVESDPYDSSAAYETETNDFASGYEDGYASDYTDYSDDDDVVEGYDDPYDTTSTVPVADVGVVVPYEGAWVTGVEDTLNAYFSGINNGDPEAAWAQLSSSSQQQTSLDEFADAVRSSYDSGFVVQQADYIGGQAQVWLEFSSTQDPDLGPNPGETCTLWSLDYVLVEQSGGAFLIDDVAGHGGTSGHTPC